MTEPEVLEYDLSEEVQGFLQPITIEKGGKRDKNVFVSSFCIFNKFYIATIVGTFFTFYLFRNLLILYTEIL